MTVASSALPKTVEAAAPATGDGFDVVFTSTMDFDDAVLPAQH